MNRFHRAGLCIAIGLCFVHSQASAQIGGAESSVPREIHIKQTITPADIAVINQAIAKDIAALVSDKSEDVKKARASLIANVTADGAGQPSVAYLDAYAASLNAAVLPLANDAKMHVRLNAAIVTEEVAERAGNGRLSEATKRFLNDKADPVALWGMKAARAILPPVFKNPAALTNQANGILPMIVPAVKNHPAMGSMVDQAYHALTLDVEPGQNIDANVVKMLVPELFNLMKVRLEAYGAALPAEPQAENRAASFLANGKVWPAMTPQQQTTSVQLLGQLMLETVRYAKVDKKNLDAMMPVYKQTAGALYVIGGAVGNKELQDAAQAAAQLALRADAAEMEKRLGPLLAGIRAAFPDAQFPPAKPPAATAPATATSSLSLIGE